MTNKSPGQITFATGAGGLPMIAVKTVHSAAEIYLAGAHVTSFVRNNRPPILFLSQKSIFAEGKAIRGGIPIIFPWFGAREGAPGAAHGFARVKNWELKEVGLPGDGSVNLQFRLMNCPEAAEFPAFTADYFVRVGEVLELELAVTHNSSDRDFIFENCLHTYFTVGDINAVSVVGLKGVKYFDKVAGMVEKTETNEAIKISSEVDRVYQDTSGTVDIIDAKLNRTIRVEKESSVSTVVWNPWIAKAKQMADFGDDEYLGMVCVESGNVGKNKIVLPPGKCARLKVRISEIE